MAKFKNKDLWIFILLLFTLPFFFYKLGQSSLVSWDEAWYAEIARNILRSGNILQLMWNGTPYIDHPPVGFWLIGSGEAIFGYTNFGVRVTSAICGLLTVIIVFLLGKKLFGRIVGFVSALSLTSSFWFLARARSGNLDVFLTMFFVLTFYLAFRAKENEKFLMPFFLVLAALILTKTLVPLTILPVLFFIFWPFDFKKFQKRTFSFPLYLFATMMASWIVAQVFFVPDFLNRFLNVGLPGVKIETSYVGNFNLAKEYLHNGIGRWFWPGVFSIILGPILFFNKKAFWVLTIFSLSFFIPFVFSSKGQIWHLIPLHPFLILGFFGFSFCLTELSLRWFSRLFKINQLLELNFSKFRAVIPGIVISVVCFYVSFIQLKQIWYSFIDIPKYISDEEILSKEAGKYGENFYIDGNFGPTAVWYAGKKVSKISNEDLRDLFSGKGSFSNQKTFILISEQYRLDHFNIPKDSYKIVKKDRDKILVLKDK